MTGEAIEPRAALEALAATIESEGEPLAAVLTPALPPRPSLGMYAAAGPRTAADPGSYAFVVESVLEGYLCHLGRPRILESSDSDLLLLAGDIFYAIGIARLAVLADPESVALLSELIRVSAELRAANRTGQAGCLWLAQVSALAFGSDHDLPGLIAALRHDEPGAEKGLETWSDGLSERFALTGRIGEVREVLHFGPADLEFP